MALKQQYQQLSTDYEQLRQLVMDMRSQMGGMCFYFFFAIWSWKRPTSSSSSSPIVLVQFFFETL